MTPKQIKELERRILIKKQLVEMTLETIKEMEAKVNQAKYGKLEQELEDYDNPPF